MRFRNAWGILLLGFAMTAGSFRLAAADPWTWGFQAGFVAPLQSDLRVTAGGGVDLGLHADWGIRRDGALRSRLDFAFFGSRDRTSVAPALWQDLHTRVRNAALGEEYLFRPSLLGGRLDFGAGLYLIRWTVHSTNSLVPPGGSFTPSGSSSWTRQGLGLLAGYRWNRRMECELRAVASHYGYENQPARFINMNVIWHL